MHSFPVPILPANRVRPRTVLVASADGSFRQRLSHELTGMRWQVREAEGGAEAWTEAESLRPDAVIVDAWLPDLDSHEFVSDFKCRFPQVDLVTVAGDGSESSPRGPYRQELLYVLRRIQEMDTSIQSGVPSLAGDAPRERSIVPAEVAAPQSATGAQSEMPLVPEIQEITVRSSAGEPRHALASIGSGIAPTERLPELVGNAPCMLEISRRVRLVAPRTTPVLIEGPTGSGKELVAEAVHRLSGRNHKPLVTINCAAIPEALLEAELFGHTRGAFTGAVQGRVGRIEAAEGGTLFLDEIGEMPLGLQAKLLRFVECGELQRVGDNEIVKVDVRLIAATHRPLAQHAASGAFRSDLYYRLAVFLIRTPALVEHSADLPMLVEHFLEKMGRGMPVKRLDRAALARLGEHSWPGNVRELEHVLERGVILAGDSPVLTSREIDFGLSVN
jgi:DNA-binding NtrC family response regulator